MKKYKGYREVSKLQIEFLYNEALNNVNKPFRFPDGSKVPYSDIFQYFKPTKYKKGFFEYCEAQNILIVKNDQEGGYHFFEKGED